MPARSEIPSTLRRSERHAQDVFVAALDSADDEYGRGERARRTAYAAVKHEYEKVGDHWERKDENGPSDEGARRRGGRTEEGVDANATKGHLMDIARRLDVHGRSSMDKAQLVEAIKKANRRASDRAR